MYVSLHLGYIFIILANHVRKVSYILSRFFLHHSSIDVCSCSFIHSFFFLIYPRRFFMFLRLLYTDTYSLWHSSSQYTWNSSSAFKHYKMTKTSLIEIWNLSLEKSFLWYRFYCNKVVHLNQIISPWAQNSRKILIL